MTILYALLVLLVLVTTITLDRQLKVLQRTLKTTKKYKYGTKQCIYKENSE